MTKIEMEDVLSSIRRLVSDDRPESTEMDNVNSDRFVLTPAFRVNATDGSARSSAAAASQQPEHDTPDAGIRDADETHAPDSALFASRRVEDDDDSGIEAVFDDPFISARDFNGSLETRIAELEIAVSRSHGEWEPDGTEPETRQMPDRRIFEVVDNGHFDKFTTTTTTATDARPATFEHHAPAGDDDREPPLQLADVALFTHTPPEALEYRRARNETAAARPDTRAAGEQRGLAAHEAVGELLDTDDDIFIEEDALRRIVAEIVRQELQGKMGERITKNVRRMVRREIERALSVKALD